MPPTSRVYMSVVEAIKAHIAAGDLLVGQRLPSIQQLARDYGVSTGSVREAARVLEAQGIIRIAHGRGMFVTASDQAPADPYEHFQDVGTGPLLAVFEARRVLEPELAALAAERATAADVAALQELVATMERLRAAGAVFTEQDVQFHRQIASAAQNPVLARMLDGINDLLLEGRRLTGQLPESVDRAMRYHALIAGSIADRNPLQARLLMLAHVNDAIDIALWVSEQQGRGRKRAKGQSRGRAGDRTVWRGADGQQIETDSVSEQVVQSLVATRR
jgi:GntR family transcriptional regulator, transcriptional repressor for pyruvate dehydrogenase complex